MKKKIINSILGLAVGLMLTGLAAAQATASDPQGTSSGPPVTSAPVTTGNEPGAGPGVHDPGHPRVNHVNTRESNEQQRIANGEKNGSLTSQEAGRLEKGENRIQNQEKADMAKDHGHLTKADKRQLNREQNRQSKRIYRAKHNKTTK